VVYLPLAQNHETGMTLYVRASVAPASLVSALRREIKGLDPDLPVPTVQPMTETIATSLYAAQMGAWLLAVFGAVAVLLAAVGIYHHSTFMPNRTMRGGVIVVGNPNELPDT
jgi:putative ABC transport system permease protein